MASESDDIQKNDLIQIAPEHKWAGCFALVSESKTFGVQAFVSIPHNDGQRPGRAYIRLEWKDFECVDARAPFVPADVDR
jgi:hypothetical protein